MGEHRQATGRLAGDGDVVRIAAELADVALHPTQRRLLIHQPVVAGRAARPRRQRGMGEEPERTEAVVDGDDHGALGGQLRRVVVPRPIGRQATAVDPHEHWATRAATVAERWRVHVQVETILTHHARRREEPPLLGATRTELGGITDASPPRCWLGCPPPQASGRRSRVRQAAERRSRR